MPPVADPPPPLPEGAGAGEGERPPPSPPDPPPPDEPAEDPDDPLDGLEEDSSSSESSSSSDSASFSASFSASCSARMSSSESITAFQMIAGQVPPSTGLPLYSVSIGVLVSRCPTQTQAVKLSLPPQNQASPLFSVVPVLPKSARLACSPVPALLTGPPRRDLTVSPTFSGITCSLRVLFLAMALPSGPSISLIATGPS